MGRPVSKTPGRPRKDDARTAAITLSTSSENKARLQRTAAANGRSVSAEVDHRLGISFALEDEVGSASVRHLLDFVRLAATAIEAETGSPWHRSRQAGMQLRGAILTYIRANSPPRPNDEIVENWSDFKRWHEKAMQRAGKTTPTLETMKEDRELIEEYGAIADVRDKLTAETERMMALGAEDTARLRDLLLIENKDG